MQLAQTPPAENLKIQGRGTLEQDLWQNLKQTGFPEKAKIKTWTNYQTAPQFSIAEL